MDQFELANQDWPFPPCKLQQSRTCFPARPTCRGVGADCLTPEGLVAEIDCSCIMLMQTTRQRYRSRWLVRDRLEPRDRALWESKVGR